MKLFSPIYDVGIHTRSSKLCYCKGASDCGINNLTLKLTACSWSNESCLSTSLSTGLTTRLASTAMRINIPYHQGSISSETRLSGSTLSWQGNLTFPPTPLWLPMPTKLFFLAPFSLFPAQSLLTVTFQDLPQNSSWVNRDLSATTEFSPWNREEGRAGHDNTIWLDLSHFCAPTGWTSAPTLLVGQHRCAASRAFGVQSSSWQAQTMITKPCYFGHCPFLLYFWAQEKWEPFHSEFKLSDSGL